MHRPTAFTALTTDRNASGCVLGLDALTVRLRPPSLLATPLPRPEHHQHCGTVR
ncbi:MAG: hypothetical protein V3R84_09305 [Acidimicrobiia bacterium]